MIKTNKIITAALLVILGYVMPGVADELHQEDGIMSNHSTEYVRSLNRNTSTDPDAAFYNPAGLAFMAKDGLHINFSSQTYYVKKTHTLDFYGLKIGENPVDAPPHKNPKFKGNLPKEYSAELTAPVLPGFDIVWKQDKWAVYLDIAVMQAALDMTFGHGLAVIDWGALLNFETTFDTKNNNMILYSRNATAIRNEMYIGATFGGAYRFFNWLSAGGGVRVIHASGNMELDVSGVNYVFESNTSTPNFEMSQMKDWDVSTDTQGLGFGIILSTHFRPEGLVSFLKGLDATFRLEYYPTMELEKKTKKFSVADTLEASGNLDIFKDGSPSDQMAYKHGNGEKNLKVTYPTTFNFGLSYYVLDWIKLLSSSQVSLRQMRDLGGREKDYGLGYQLGLGVEFILTPKITLSTGYLYNDFGIKPEKRSEADPLLCSHQLGAGALFHVDDDVDFNCGMFYQYFVPVRLYQVKYVQVSEPTYSYLKKDLDEKRISISIGVTYRMFSGNSSTDNGEDEDDEDDTKDIGTDKIKGKEKDVNKDKKKIK